MGNIVYFGDCIDVLKTLPDESVNLIYVDPPFNTNKVQKLTSKDSIGSMSGTAGFGGKKYVHHIKSEMSYVDVYDDYINDFLGPSLTEAYRVLSPNGTLYLHLDWRETHYAKVFCDRLFGRENFKNEIIWSFDFGGRSKTKWSAKHNNILMYVKDNKNYTFRYDDIDRIPYMAPSLQKDRARAELGKTVTSVWWQTIVPTNGFERTGYPTQKPIQIVKRIVKVSSNPGDVVLDFCGGSGTTAVAAHQLGRKFILIDNNISAIDTMKKRFESLGIIDVGFVTK